MKEKPQDTATIAQTCETKQKLQEEAAVKKIEREFGNRYATVTVRHGLNTYTGKRKLKTPEGMVWVKDALEACSSGKAASFRLETEDGFVYFPAQILKKCVFSLVVEN
jgi:osmotically-inducible protein OsmY